MWSVSVPALLRVSVPSVLSVKCPCLQCWVSRAAVFCNECPWLQSWVLGLQCFVLSVCACSVECPSLQCWVSVPAVMSVRACNVECPCLQCWVSVPAVLSVRALDLLGPWTAPGRSRRILAAVDVGVAVAVARGGIVLTSQAPCSTVGLPGKWRRYRRSVSVEMDHRSHL